MSAPAPLWKGVDKKVQRLARLRDIRRRRVTARTRDDAYVDVLRAEAAALDFAVDFIREHEDLAKEFLHARRVKFRQLEGEA